MAKSCWLGLLIELFFEDMPLEKTWELILAFRYSFAEKISLSNQAICVCIFRKAHGTLFINLNEKFKKKMFQHVVKK